MSLIERYLDRFGPYAFGVISLLIIWFVIVAPELDRTRASAQEFRDVADTQRKTAEVLDRAVLRLEMILNRMENRPQPLP